MAGQADSFPMTVKTAANRQSRLTPSIASAGTGLNLELEFHGRDLVSGRPAWYPLTMAARCAGLTDNHPPDITMRRHPSPSLATKERAEQMMLHQGNQAEAFESFKVDAAVGNTRNKGPELINPIRKESVS